MKVGLSLFREHVREILVRHCVECHGADEPEGSLNLLTRESLLTGGDSGTAVVPGKPEKSLLWKLVSHQARPHMPMEREKLDEKSLKSIRDWIENEAPYDCPLTGSSGIREEPITRDHREFWSFRPLVRPTIPDSDDSGVTANAIDEFVLARQIAAGFTLAPRADRIRRLTFDLCGLPPSEAEVDAFVEDQRPDAWPILVDRLLASPHFGERQARRLPLVQRGGTGRDHNPNAFTTWFAGGGTRGGTHFGSTDEIGLKAVGNRVSVHDLHATILHTLGVNHKQLTFRHNGRDIRLTDVSGNPVREILIPPANSRK